MKPDEEEAARQQEEAAQKNWGRDPKTQKLYENWSIMVVFEIQEIKEEMPDRPRTEKEGLPPHANWQKRNKRNARELDRTFEAHLLHIPLHRRPDFSS